jgi:hypothetical protein
MSTIPDRTNYRLSLEYAFWEGLSGINCQTICPAILRINACPVPIVEQASLPERLKQLGFKKTLRGKLLNLTKRPTLEEHEIEQTERTLRRISGQMQTTSQLHNLVYIPDNDKLAGEYLKTVSLNNGNKWVVQKSQRKIKDCTLPIAYTYRRKGHLQNTNLGEVVQGRLIILLKYRGQIESYEEAQARVIASSHSSRRKSGVPCRRDDSVL